MVDHVTLIRTTARIPAIWVPALRSSVKNAAPRPGHARAYSTPRPNLFDFGKPCARRPASARLPRQSDNSFIVMLCSRPAESFQESPLLESKVATSDSAALVDFCKRTPRPRALSGH